VNREFSMCRDQHRREVLDPDARSARHDHHVCIRLQSLENRRRVVADEAWEVDDRAIRALGGRPMEWPYRSRRGTLTRKISSPIGRLDYARVRVTGDRVEPLSVSGASVLSSTTRADGFVIVSDDSEGFPSGAEVDVWLYA